MFSSSVPQFHRNRQMRKNLKTNLKTAIPIVLRHRFYGIREFRRRVRPILSPPSEAESAASRAQCWIPPSILRNFRCNRRARRGGPTRDIASSNKTRCSTTFCWPKRKGTRCRRWASGERTRESDRNSCWNKFDRFRNCLICITVYYYIIIYYGNTLMDK